MLDQQGKVTTTDELAPKKPNLGPTEIPDLPAQEIPTDTYIRGIVQNELMKLVGLKLGAGNTNTMRMDSESGLWFASDTFASAVLALFLNGKLKIQYHDYANGTTGGPESDSDLVDGIIYIAANFGGAGTHKLRARVGGAWKEATLS